MGSHIKVPWSIRLRGSKSSDGPNWWQRRKFHDDPGDHPVLQQEQDLDHLGTLHDTVLHPEKD